MINKKLFDTDVQQYINANLKSDLHSLLLKKSPFQEVSMSEIVQQIKGKKVAEKKFPFLLKDGIVFPPNLNLEQASSETTANYKNQLLKGQTFVDLTAGFGIDAYFVSQNFQKTTLVEQNLELLKIVRHNWEILGQKALFINDHLEDFLEQNQEKFNCVYLDPARRNAEKNKVFLLEDLSPNLLEIQKKLKNISNQILIKLSPLIDISYLISVLEHLSEIHIVAVKNEVKELLVLINHQSTSQNVRIKTVNLETQEPDFEFYFDEITNAKSEFSEPQNFLYIPNNALLKSGAFDLISEKFNLKKLHPNTHFYTSFEKIENFPGRILSVKKIESNQITKGEKFNLISKNYPLKPEEIKKKYKLKDGGNQYLIFTESINGKIILQSI